jgi:hypothetical protein
LINGAEGQVWTLQKIDDKILCGHDRGLFEINRNSIRNISTEPGVMSILRYNNDILFTGNYSGISIFKKENNSWRFIKKMNVILGAINQIVKEKENFLWVNIPNYGFIRFEINNQFNPINRKIFNTKKFKGYFPSIFRDKKGIHVITTTHQYVFNSIKNDFEPEKNR